MYTTEYMYLKGALKALDLNRSLKAMAIMYELHDGQTRNDGSPYYAHPVKVANYLFTLLKGILSIEQLDMCIAVALLHDVVEDCENGYEIIVKKCDKMVADFVLVLSKNRVDVPSDIDLTSAYYKTIEDSMILSLVKCSDRCHNVSTMAGVFDTARLKKYIEETEKYVLPLVRHTRECYPEVSNVMVIMSYHIKSVIEAIKAVMVANLMED